MRSNIPQQTSQTESHGYANAIRVFSKLLRRPNTFGFYMALDVIALMVFMSYFGILLVATQGSLKNAFMMAFPILKLVVDGLTWGCLETEGIDFARSYLIFRGLLDLGCGILCLCCHILIGDILAASTIGAFVAVVAPEFITVPSAMF